MTTEIDYARLAAYVDGEGCFSIQKNLPSNKNRIHNPSCSFSIILTSTNEDIMDWLEINFNGKTNSRQVEGNRKRQYEWKVHGKTAIKLVLKIEPYMIIKKKQLIVVLEFNEKYILKGTIGKYSPQWKLRYGEECYQKMKALNYRGLKEEEFPNETI